jgi:hypothetical protein
MRWLWTPTALKAHGVFLPLIGFLAYVLLAGKPVGFPDEPWHILLFCGLAYPTVLLLTWLKCRINGGGEF